jgi:hypothetical protein
MHKSIIPTLQNTFGDRAISPEDKQAFEQAHGFVLGEDLVEFEETEGCYYLTPEALEHKPKKVVNQEALGLGDLEDQLVEVLQKGKDIPWGKLALAMWLFFLFIVVYTVVETIF